MTAMKKKKKRSEFKYRSSAHLIVRGWCKKNRKKLCLKSNCFQRRIFPHLLRRRKL